MLQQDCRAQRCSKVISEQTKARESLFPSNSLRWRTQARMMLSIGILAMTFSGSFSPKNQVDWEPRLLSIGILAGSLTDHSGAFGLSSRKRAMPQRSPSSRPTVVLYCSLSSTAASLEVNAARPDRKRFASASSSCGAARVSRGNAPVLTTKASTSLSKVCLRFFFAQPRLQ